MTRMVRMARKKTQQTEDINNENQVVVDQQEKDPWDGYYDENGSNQEDQSSVEENIDKETDTPDIDIDDTPDIDVDETLGIVDAAERRERNAQVNMNDITRAAFVQIRSSAACPNKEVDDFTIREFKKANAHLKGVIRSQMAGDKFDLPSTYTSLLCLLALAYINEVDMNEYFKINV